MNADETTLDLGGLRAVSVGDPETAKVVVVLLHGFQMSPEDLSPFAHSLQAPAWFLFPDMNRDQAARFFGAGVALQIRFE